MTSSHMSDADSDYNPRLQDDAFDYDSSDQEGYLLKKRMMNLRTMTKIT